MPPQGCSKILKTVEKWNAVQTKKNCCKVIPFLLHEEICNENIELVMNSILIAFTHSSRKPCARSKISRSSRISRNISSMVSFFSRLGRPLFRNFKYIYTNRIAPISKPVCMMYLRRSDRYDLSDVILSARWGDSIFNITIQKYVKIFHKKAAGVLLYSGDIQR